MVYEDPEMKQMWQMLIGTGPRGEQSQLFPVSLFHLFHMLKAFHNSSRKENGSIYLYFFWSMLTEKRLTTQTFEHNIFKGSLSF